jgi:RNA polymerase sigma-70 factor (ECF subfamily)
MALSCEELAAALARGEQAWPGVQVDAASFAAYLELRTASARSEHGEDLFLAFACLSGNTAAHAFLERDLLRVVHQRLKRQHGATIADDALATVRVALLAPNRESTLAAYRGDGPLAAWVRTCLSREAVAIRRSRGLLGDEDLEAAEVFAAQDDPELAVFRRRYQQRVEQALAAAVTQLERRQRILLRFAFVDRLSVDQIGAIFHVGRATAARWLSQAREVLRASVLVQVKAELRVSSSEANSLLTLLDSQLDISLPRLLRG